MKKILSILAAIFALCAFVPFALASTAQFQVNTLSGGSLTTGLVSYYNMQGNSNDYWGSNNGTDSNITYGNTYGKVSEGAYFDGSNSYIQITNSLSLSNDAMTWAGWIKPSVFGSPYGRMFSIGTASDNLIVDMNNSGNIQANYYKGSNIMTINTSGYSTGVWYFVALVLSTSSQKLYINNSLAGSATVSLPTAPTWTNNYIGWDGGGGWFNGDIDEVLVSAKALSTNELTDLYNAGAGQTMCNGTGGPVCASGGSVDRIILISMKPEHFAYA